LFQSKPDDFSTTLQFASQSSEYGASRNSSIKYLVLIAIIVATVYLNALPCGFVWDDIPQVRDNLYIRSLRYLPILVKHDLWITSGLETASGYFRPMQNISYAFDYQIFKTASWGYHLTNVLLHLFCCILVFFLVRLTGLAREAAFLAAAFFAVHPLHVEEVTFIGGRGGLLSAFFLLCCLAAVLLAYEAKTIRRRVWFYIAASVLLFLAMLSKPLAILFPIALGLTPFIKRPFDSPSKKAVYGFLIAAAGYVVVGLYFLLLFFIAKGTVHKGVHEISFLKVVACMPDITGLYIKKILFPLNLSIDYDIPIPHGLFSLPSMVWVVFLCVLGGFTVFGILRGSAVAYWAGLFWVITLPLAGLLRFPAIIADRYVYIPIASVGVLLGSIWAMLKNRSPKLEKAFLAFIGCMILMYGIMTIQRNAVFKDDLTLFQDTVKKSPFKSRPLRAYAIALANVGRYEEVFQVFDTAEKYNPKDASIHIEKADIHSAMGNKNAALHDLDRALELDPKNDTAMTNIGNIAFENQDYQKAFEWTSKAVSANPDNVTAKINMAIILRISGKHEQAISLLKSVLQTAPLSPKANEYLGLMLLEGGRPKEAIPFLTQSLDLVPDQPQVIKALSEAQSKTIGK